jgi:hypothetical protein
MAAKNHQGMLRTHTASILCYTSPRLVWQLDDNANQEPRRFLCGLARRQARFLIRVNRLAVALAKSQDHRASCGVFAFGRRNAVRRWLRLGYPAARASQGRERGLRIERGGRAERSASLSSVSDGMAPKSIPSKRSGTVMSHGKGCALLQHSPKSIK